ncbi:MAG TPA: MFS transporter [Chitinophagaceae bacterium]|nr:MFS transporter [Chitinophagaceae bacterium]
MQQSIGKFRWTICAMVFFATTINYLDRAVISLLKKTLTLEYNWTELDYGNIVIAFQLSYAIGLFASGRLVDKWGSKIGYATALFLWSIAAMAHAFVRGTGGFIAVRAALGLTESANFPAAVKTVTEWFPKKERAFATGIFNSGTNIGAILAPLTVPFIAEHFGWRWAFIITGGIGLIWLIFWFLIYDVPAKHKKLSKEEFDYIHSDQDEIAAAEKTKHDKVPWLKLLGYRQTWVFAVGKFLTDPVWWFYLFWLPDFLDKEYHMSGTSIALPIALVYTLSSIGSIYGGWLPMTLINKHWPVFKARRTSMLIYALCAVPAMFAQYLGSINLWLAIFIIGFATAAHQAWSANIYTVVSDLFPKKAVASVIGIGGMCGAVGGILIARLAPKLFIYFKAQGNEQTGYFIMFIICGTAYLLAWLIMKALVPREKIAEI